LNSKKLNIDDIDENDGFNAILILYNSHYVDVYINKRVIINTMAFNTIYEIYIHNSII